MATITIEVPDELAAKIDQFRDRLPYLLSEALMLTVPDGGTKTAPSSHNRVFEEMTDFLASCPTSKQILAYKISAPVQERLAELLENNREEGLTEAENSELDAFAYVDFFMSLLKARARCIPKA